jgi:PIN domain nuclease of toxin-antitoxin system
LILLDTCTLLWLASHDEKLPEVMKAALRETRVGTRFISAINAFEIAVKYAKRQLDLPLEPQLWIDSTCAQRGLTCIAISDRIACKAAALPPIHKDPADRILIATALEHGLTLLTPDAHIRAYPGLRTRWEV